MPLALRLLLIVTLILNGSGASMASVRMAQSLAAASASMAPAPATQRELTQRGTTQHKPTQHDPLQREPVAEGAAPVTAGHAAHAQQPVAQAIATTPAVAASAAAPAATHRHAQPACHEAATPARVAPSSAASSTNTIHPSAMPEAAPVRATAESGPAHHTRDAGHPHRASTHCGGSCQCACLQSSLAVLTAPHVPALGVRSLAPSRALASTRPMPRIAPPMRPPIG